MDAAAAIRGSCGSADATLDLLALALAAAFGPVEAARALATLDGLGAEVVRVLDGSARTPRAEALALSHVLGTVHGFTGDTEQYDRPENSMLDRVLERQRGLPILLSVVYVEAARRADVPLAGVGLPGHYVVAHFGAIEPLLLDPFSGGAEVTGDAPSALVRPWSPHGPRCGCSTIWSPRSGAAVTSLALYAPPKCDSRFRAIPTSTTACVPSLSRFAPDSTERARRFRRNEALQSLVRATVVRHIDER